MDMHAFGKHTWAKGIRVAYILIHMHKSELVNISYDMSYEICISCACISISVGTQCRIHKSSSNTTLKQNLMFVYIFKYEMYISPKDKDQAPFFE